MKVINKKARFKFKLLEKLEAGISLFGGEAKAVRNSNINISNAWVKIIKNQPFLINANIPIQGKIDYQPTRTRRLLLHKHQISSLKTKIKAKSLTLIPVSVYTKKRLIKVEIALAKAKRKFEKKETIKKKDIERELERELKDRKN